MNSIISRRVTAQLDGEIVVFLIGMRINRFWKLHQWWPIARAMSRMLKELRPEAGFLGGRTWFGNPAISVQYWRSFEDLERYARHPGQPHLPAWTAFNKAVGGNGDVGIWHETYRVRPGDCESIYVNMPPFGLGRATGLAPVAGAKTSACGRMRGGAP